MKLKVILTLKHAKDETPKITHEGIIDSNMGILNVGAIISQLLSAIWQEFRAREQEFNK